MHKNVQNALDFEKTGQNTSEVTEKVRDLIYNNDDVYDSDIDESKTIRVANHFKEGVSGKAYISDYNTIEELNKAIEDTISKAQKATENTQTLQSKKITPSNDVDIMMESDYNEYKVTRKREPNNYVYKKITDKDRARVSSDYMLNKSKYDGKNFVHFSDVSYGYEINNDNIVILNKFKGSQKFINVVEEAWENGFDKISNGSIKVIESIRSAKRRSSISNGIDRGQQQGGTSNRKDTGYGRQQRNTNGTKTIKNNGDNLKNSEQSSFSLPKTDNQGRTLTREQQNLRY